MPRRLQSTGTEKRSVKSERSHMSESWPGEIYKVNRPFVLELNGAVTVA
jgi:hypothetical protein